MKSKFVLGVAFTLFSLSLSAQQKGFADGAKYFDVYQKGPHNSTYVTPGNGLDTNDIIPGTQYLAIDFSFDPESTDEQKEKYISELMEDLKKLPEVYGKDIKGLRFQIGEQIFLSRSEADKLAENYSKKAKLNLEKAWKRMSPELIQMYPGATFYAENWGW